MSALLASVIAPFLGPVVAAGVSRVRASRAGLDMFVVVTIAGLVLAQILPHSAELAGWPALPTAAAGLLAVSLLHRHVDHDSTHETVSVFAVAGLALFVHAVLDGVALAGGEHDAASAVLPAAIVIHRVPVGLSIWWLARPALGSGAALVALALVSAATTLGFFVGGELWDAAPASVLGMFQALVAGALLHVAFSHRPHVEAEGRRLAIAIGAVLAVLVLASTFAL